MNLTPDDIDSQRIADILGASYWVPLQNRSSGGPLDWLALRAEVAHLQRANASTVEPQTANRAIGEDRAVIDEGERNGG